MHLNPSTLGLLASKHEYARMAEEIPMFRGYTDAFGHAQVLAGGIDAMVDFDLNPWDAAATECLVQGAGGAIRVHAQDNGKVGLVFGSPALVDALEAILAEAEIA